MLISRCKSGELEDSHFYRLPELIGERDIFVFNRSRVIPARLFGSLLSGAVIEVLLLSELSLGVWKCLAKPLKKLSRAKVIRFSDTLQAEVQLEPQHCEVQLRFSANGKQASNEEIFSHGLMPIPPYIRQGRADAEDSVDYQPHFAHEQGSIAAPTASLHFTPELLKDLQAKGAQCEYVLLHVGKASVQPLIRTHESSITAPPPERYRYDAALLKRLMAAKARGKRIIAVGTTVVRALESMVREKNGDQAERSASVFITPGFNFQVVDAMLTNFHQPASSHLLLVEAFMGRALLEQSYCRAVADGYRFLSYGDGMLVLNE